MVATSSFAVAASSLFALSFGAPLPRSNAAHSLVGRAAYRIFGGDGTTATGWPEQSKWLSFEQLWAANERILKSSCTQYPGSPPNNSDDENDLVKAAIISAAANPTVKAAGVNEQYILAIMMQESKGCVRAPTTNYGVRNPGLMQDHDGKSTCNEGGVSTPCPKEQIEGMILEGVGIGTDFGLLHTVQQSGADDVSKYYKGARIYNSGSVDSSGNLGAGIATHCYASDIANRLLGWVDEKSACDEASIGSETGSGPGNGDTTNPPPETPSDPPTPTNPTTPTATATVATTPTTPTTPTTGDDTPSGPKGQGASDKCKKWFTVKKGDDCRSAGISFEALRKLNTGLDATCSNLWLGSSYCISE